MRRFIQSIVAAVVAGSSVVASASADQQPANALSGSAVNALVKAYSASGLGGKTPAPLALRPYIVTIRLNEDRFEVLFLSETDPAAIPVVVSARTGEVVPLNGPGAGMPPNLPGDVVLPGIIAGEIIAAYRQALTDGTNLVGQGYSVWYQPWAGGSDVGFELEGRASGGAAAQPTVWGTANQGKCAASCVSSIVYWVRISKNHIDVSRRRH